MELSYEIAIFLQDANHARAETFRDEKFLTMLAYLADIFAQQNELSLSLQGYNANRFKCREKMEAFKGKVRYWKRRIQLGQVSQFALLGERLEDREPPQGLLQDILIHLNLMEEKIENYVGEPEVFPEWVQEPFLANIEGEDEHAGDLIELKNDGRAKILFKTTDITSFWAQQLVSYHRLSIIALSYLTPFPTTYLCEKAFSTLVDLKTRKRNRMDASAQMRLSLSENTQV